jgi:hypothetical protein
VEHTHYKAPIAVAVLSLLLQRRPRADTGVLGDLTCEGLLGPIDDWSVEWVDACVAQGLRRMVVSDVTELPEDVKDHAAARLGDGRPRLEFMLYKSIFDAFPDMC